MTTGRNYFTFICIVIQISRMNNSLNENIININISLERWTMRAERGYKEKTLSEIMEITCALLNSGGGKLTLVNESKLSLSTQQRIQDTCVRMIEQRILEFTNLCILAAKISVSYFQSHIVFDIGHDDRQPFTLNYNLYLPSHTQVLAIQGSEMLEKTREVLRAKNVAEKVVLLGSHQKKFIQLEHVEVQQSKAVQFKNLKARASKCVTLGDRMIGKSNKLSCYVSAFANHRGGHIYYGINDDGTVEGENIADGNNDEVIRKVKKTIGKMVFPKKGCNRPEKGKDWEIFFEPVEDAKGDPIRSTFVIVIYVAHCPGGVFTEEPESYHVVEGQITKMSFDIWHARLTQTSHAPLRTTSIPHPVPRTSWSSNGRKKFFQKLTTMLMKLRNQGDTKGFRDLSFLAKKRFPESDAHLIVEAEETVMACKQNFLQKASKLQETFAKLLTSTKDLLIYEVRSLHLQSMIKRRDGKYAESYELAQEGLQKMQIISPGFNTVWFYIHAAMVAIVNPNNKQDLNKSCTLNEEARRYLDLAERDAHSLDDSVEELSDIRQKLHIYRAFVSLNCPVTGEHGEQEGKQKGKRGEKGEKEREKEAVKEAMQEGEQEGQQEQHKITDKIQAATKQLAFVYENALMGNPLTPYRKVQYLLSQSDLLYRRAVGRREENATENAKRAFELVAESLCLAKKRDFQDMIQYATNRRANLTEKLVRNALASKEKKKPLSHSLETLDLI